MQNLSLQTVLLESFHKSFENEQVRIEQVSINYIFVTIKCKDFDNFNLLTLFFLREQKLHGIESMDVKLIEYPKKRIKYFVMIREGILRIGLVAINTVTKINIHGRQKLILGIFDPVSSFLTLQDLSDIFYRNQKYRKEGFRGAKEFFYRGQKIEDRNMLFADFYEIGIKIFS
jgi:hypothetical protein